MRIQFILLMLLLLVASSLSAQDTKKSTDGDGVLDVSLCNLAVDPAAFNQRLVQLTGFVTHGFEDFGLAEPSCEPFHEKFSLWLMLGGKRQSGTIYCCPGEAGQEARQKSLAVEGIEVPLVEDQVFLGFENLLHREPSTTIRVTLIGRFFAGNKHGNDIWDGYGHLGCCSLLAIQQIVAFEPHLRKDLDYTAEAGWYEKEGCKAGSVEYKKFVSIHDRTGSEAIKEQQKADDDSKSQSWAFDEPERVAIESLKSIYPGKIPVVQGIKTSSARRVYRWKSKGRLVTIVVTRPYWLSFYAKSGSVIWIASTIKEAECD